MKKSVIKRKMNIVYFSIQGISHYTLHPPTTWLSPPPSHCTTPSPSHYITTHTKTLDHNTCDSNVIHILHPGIYIDISDYTRFM